MTVVTMTQAKAQLSRLLTQVQEGGEVIIARRGRPVAKLLPVIPETRPRAKSGVWRGRIGFGISDSFFDPLPEHELALWNGEGD